MATTKLWHIQGRLKDLVDYVENPEKTVKPGLQDFFNVFSYTQNPDKTAGGQFVTAINCQKDIALQQMILTKQRYGKEDGYIAWHGYQSFKPGEVTPEQCHALGVELAKQMWGGRFQIIVTTHLDKEHLHNHFCINSVSFKDGGKYNFSKKELKRVRETSDRLCREHGLSVVERPHKAPSRQVWLDEQAGKPTRYNIYRADVQQAIDCNATGKQVVQHLRKMGYIVDTGGANLKIRLPQYPHFTRLDTLNPNWTNKGLEHLIYDRDISEFGRPERPQVLEIPDWLKTVYQPRKRTMKIHKPGIVTMLPELAEYFFRIVAGRQLHGLFQFLVDTDCTVPQEIVNHLFVQLSVMFPHKSFLDGQNALLNAVLFREHLPQIHIAVHSAQDVHGTVANVAEHIAAGKVVDNGRNCGKSLWINRCTYNADVVILSPKRKLHLTIL